MRKYRLYRVIKIALVVLIAWTLLAWGASRWLMTRAELGHADVIVVLSGSMFYRERAQRAAQLYAEKRAPLILLTNDTTQSGWSMKLQKNPFFVDRAKEELLGHGVPESSIIVAPEPVAGTYDEARVVRQIVTERKIGSVLLVTSAFHSRRTLWTFKKVMADSGTEIGLEFSNEPSAISLAFWWLSPQGWRNVAGEYVKIFYYWLKGLARKV